MAQQYNSENNKTLKPATQPPFSFSPKLESTQSHTPILSDTLNRFGLDLQLEKLEIKKLINTESSKLLFPAKPSYAVRQAMLRYMATCKEADPDKMLRTRAIENVEKMINTSGAKKIKVVNFNLDPVNAFYAYKRKQTAERTARIIKELNSFDEK